jgi:hypothetical protein
MHILLVCHRQKSCVKHLHLPLVCYCYFLLLLLCYMVYVTHLTAQSEAGTKHVWL